ncbi:MAG: glycine cleavage system protein GcvH [Endomicrobiales bacterium]|nr:glycine cleavage system protein GcvH [Endomicrobiales bacterium]
MSNIPKDLRYTKTHEWAKKENGKIRVGITDHAQHEITDVVHVELPQVGKSVEKGASACVIESVKSAFDIYSPVSGKIAQVNDTVTNSPELVNSSPYEQGYLFVIEPSKPEEFEQLLSGEDYEQTVKNQ